MERPDHSYGELVGVELADYHDLHADGGVKDRRIGVFDDYAIGEENIIAPSDVDRLIEDGDDNIFHRKATGYREQKKLEQFDDMDVLPVDVADVEVRLINGVGPFSAYIVNEDQPIAAVYDVQTGAPFLAHVDPAENDRFVPELAESDAEGYDAEVQVWRTEADGTTYDKNGEPVADTGAGDHVAPIQGQVAYADDDAPLDNEDTAFGLIEYMGGWDRQYADVNRGPDILLGFPEITVHSDLQDANRLVLDERRVTDDEKQRSIDTAFEDNLQEKLELGDDELAVTTYDARLLKETDDGVEPFMDVQERDLELLRPLDAYGDDYEVPTMFQVWNEAMENTADFYEACMDLWLAPFRYEESGGRHELGSD